jgi:hypothetical protein
MMKKSAFMKAMIEVASLLLREYAPERTHDADLAAVYARGRNLLLVTDSCPDDRNPIVQAALSIFREAAKFDGRVPPLAQLRMQMEVERAWEHYEEQSRPRVSKSEN